MYSVVTNCTYDGLCYNAVRAQALLEQSCDRIHFDEAWYGYARFNPMYENHFAMRGDPAAHKGPTVFATHSTHKLLAALSQASFIHVRDGKGAIEHHRFNQAYMMHTSTSPLYAIVASNDITERDDGRQRRTVPHAGGDPGGSRLPAGGRAASGATFAEKKTWFFKPWNVESVTDREAAARLRSRTRAAELLCNSQDPWKLKPGDKWHGFDEHRARLVHARSRSR